MLDVAGKVMEQFEHTGNLPSHFIFAVRHLEQAATGRLTLRRGVSRTMSLLPLLLRKCWLKTVTARSAWVSWETKAAFYTSGARHSAGSTIMHQRMPIVLIDNGGLKLSYLVYSWLFRIVVPPQQIGVYGGCGVW